MIANCRLTIADWRFDGGTDLQLPIADLKSAITRDALAEELNERCGVYKRLVEASPNAGRRSILAP